MKKNKSLFQQLHEANEKIKQLQLIHDAINQDYNDLVIKLKAAAQEPLINEKLNKFYITISKL